jgi:hypothetical protein
MTAVAATSTRSAASSGILNAGFKMANAKVSRFDDDGNGPHRASRCLDPRKSHHPISNIAPAHRDGANLRSGCEPRNPRFTPGFTVIKLFDQKGLRRDSEPGKRTRGSCAITRVRMSASIDPGRGKGGSIVRANPIASTHGSLTSSIQCDRIFISTLMRGFTTQQHSRASGSSGVGRIDVDVVT